jgi:hypothetical protein
VLIYVLSMIFTIRKLFGENIRRILEEGANVAVLDPDVAKAFSDSVSVNEALRSLLELTRATQRLTKRSSGRGIETRR